MKQIIIDIDKVQEKILLSDVDLNKSIFAKKGGKLVGMLIHEDEGWILRFGSGAGLSGYYEELRPCIENSLIHGYTFHVDC